MKPNQFKTELIALLPRLKRYALTLTRATGDADDLLQDTCTQALANWKKYDPSQPLDRWAFTIMRNGWFSEQRKRKVRMGSGQTPIEDMHDLSDNHNADEHLYANQVGNVVQKLPTDLSSTLLLVAKEGYSYKEAAQALDVPVGTIMSRIHRARQMVSQSLNRGSERGDKHE
ncbi:RNA polymerase sigma factor [Lentilitoribacter sp. EG35]|uniref:RNA polymerase sigma factor n=1 Tax=Lentilitoribacter sp. EG35 TaxID=3234192 RepID=UPI00345FABED